MQVTIVQAEIHEAIRKHILSLIDVKEGARIDIQLKATRGEDGTTAIIDIVPDDGSADVPATTNVQPAPAPVASKSSTAVKAKPAAAATAAEKPKEIPAATAEEVVEGTAADVSQEELDARAADATDLNAAQEEPAQEAVEEEAPASTEEQIAEVKEEAAEAAAAEATPARQSLFAGLKSDPK